MAANRLLTFAPMIDSETTRLLCRWYGIAYHEEDHLFGWVSLLTLLHGGYGRVPLLFGPSIRLSGPRAVADHHDPLAPPDRRLLRRGTSQSAGVEADWSAYNGGLAADVAVFAYFHLLAERRLMTPVFAAPLPPSEARLIPPVYPAMAWLLATLLRLTPERAAESESRIRMGFAALDRRLSDGRRFLLGAQLTLGDIALAAAVAPLLQPPGYGALMPPVPGMPPRVRELIVLLRSHRSSDYIDRVYTAVGAAAVLNNAP